MGVVSVMVVVDMLMIGRPDFTCIEVRKVPCVTDARNFSRTLRLVMPLVTLMIDDVLMKDSRALLFLRPSIGDTFTALAGTPSASDTLPTMASKNKRLEACP
jgi:hypothetical protein